MIHRILKELSITLVELRNELMLVMMMVYDTFDCIWTLISHFIERIFTCDVGLPCLGWWCCIVVWNALRNQRLIWYCCMMSKTYPSIKLGAFKLENKKWKKKGGKQFRYSNSGHHNFFFLTLKIEKQVHERSTDQAKKNFTKLQSYGFERSIKQCEISKHIWENSKKTRIVPVFLKGRYRWWASAEEDEGRVQWVQYQDLWCMVQ